MARPTAKHIVKPKAEVLSTKKKQDKRVKTNGTNKYTKKI